MLCKFLMKLSSDSRLSFQKSSLFQGVLMEMLDDAYATKLHESMLKPYAQTIKKMGNETFWQICTLNEQAFQQIILPIANGKLDLFQIKHNENFVSIIERNMIIESYQDLISKYYFGNCTRSIKIRFISPTAFKQNDNYVFYPNMELIYNSLMNKYDMFSEENGMRSEDVLMQLIEDTKIIKYNLRSVPFYMEGIKIPAFMGDIQLKISGPQSLVNLIHLLFEFGCYSGIGIKTAIGMGAIEIVKEG